MLTDEIISQDQQFSYKGYANGMDDLMLLFIALIENAAPKGKRFCSNNETVVEVYLSKTKDGCLWILNEVDEKGSLERIRFFMTRPPLPKGGISIWSIFRYLLAWKSFSFWE